MIQAEDELAAIGMAIGAGWAGARALTATSGPGISLMTEFVGMGYFAEIPVVIIDVQRMGPSTGLPTRTSQGDVLKMHLLGHGDCRHIVLLPGSVEECYELVVEALDLAQHAVDVPGGTGEQRDAGTDADDQVMVADPERRGEPGGDFAGDAQGRLCRRAVGGAQ